MTPAETRKLKYHLREVAKLLKEDTPESELQDFETIELAARKHLLETVGPEIGEFFWQQENQQKKAKSVK